jgi:IQ motif/SEC7 domain-containing protein
MELSGMQVDVALRKFQTYFRMPGESQKIERLMEVFCQRYCQCNQDVAAGFHSPDTVFVLAFAITMLNTDLYTPSLKPEKRMKLEEFIKNLHGKKVRVCDNCSIHRNKTWIFMLVKSEFHDLKFRDISNFTLNLSPKEEKFIQICLDI